VSKKKNKQKKQPEAVVETKLEEPIQTNATDFIKSNSRQAKLRPNSTKRLRYIDEIAFVNTFTEMYVTGELSKEDIKILADTKAYLLALPGNPYNLKEGEANAMICSDMKHLCAVGEIIDNERVKLEAKELSANRVTYWNPVLAQQIMQKEQDEAKKAEMQERYKILRDLQTRTGYGH